MYWESSKRPLFIKTVWKDGQHHVLLNKEELTIKSRRYISPRAIKKSPRYTRSSTDATLTNMKICSYKVFEGFKNPDQCNKSTRCKSESNQFKIQTVLDKTFSGVAKTHQSASVKKLNLSIKSNSIDLNDIKYSQYDCVRDSTSIECNHIGSNNSEFNTLSQRVMVWLDLALQNDEIDKHVKPLTTRLNSIPVSSNLKKIKTTKNRKSAPVCPKNQEFLELTDTFNIKPAPETVKTRESNLSKQESLQYNSDNDSDSKEPPLISSVVENDIKMPKVPDELSSDKIMTMKRQIHIFMPFLQNKRDDGDCSVLSSNLSSYSSKMCPLFCA